jgi:hypothetical protein
MGGWRNDHEDLDEAGTPCLIEIAAQPSRILPFTYCIVYYNVNHDLQHRVDDMFKNHPLFTDWVMSSLMFSVYTSFKGIVGYLRLRALFSQPRNARSVSALIGKGESIEKRHRFRVRDAGWRHRRPG